ncbi:MULTISPECIES: hypothetical protein [Mycobacteriaceae]|uniref:Uncharacterized protein n=1 Tax=Mycolicibacterium fluoranthenivorans TaxID=258505 RepID=A0A1G4W1U0_9MYCO|nr:MULTISPECIES: hypothetical protein [Mycobacteriaceae]MCV7251171.1 hypothetical protein [Mycobacterium hackensackense]SCX15342.1 hypothetical protein SAMN02799620_02040 [Mycolicibacterium fluoranthenivorans]
MRINVARNSNTQGKVFEVAQVPAIGENVAVLGVAYGPVIDVQWFFPSEPNIDVVATVIYDDTPEG